MTRKVGHANGQSMIDTAVQHSQERIRLLETIILRPNKLQAGTEKLEYFIATCDLDTGLYYSPRSTWDLRILKSAVGPDGGEAELVTEAARSLFSMTASAAQFARSVSGRLLQISSKGRRLFCVTMDKDGVLTDCSNTQACDDDVKAFVAERIAKSYRVNKDVNRGMEALRPATGKALLKLLVFLPDHDPRTEQGPRGTRLIQMGLCFAKETCSTDDLARALEGPCDASAYASWVVLYEKERYHQKALRQSTKGYITKYGDHSDISTQIDKLDATIKDLKKTGNYGDALMAEVLKPRDIEPKTAFRWYRMRRFTLPSLLDIFTSTEGLARYEVSALVRSCVLHLDSTYWRGVSCKDPRPAGVYWGSMALSALSRVRDACKNISKYTSAIRSGTPAKFQRTIELFSTDAVVLYQPVIDWMSDKNASAVFLRVNWKGKGRTYECSHPRKLLESALTDLEPFLKLSAPRFRARKAIHGDAHFGNFLVDASVPEDPLICSIDPSGKPRQVPALHPDWTSTKIGKAVKQSPNEYPSWAQDPLWDVAKLLVSSACGYGLAFRNAFKIVKEDANGWMVKYDADLTPRKLSDVAGLSGAQIVSVDGGVPVDAWEYHHLAAETVLDAWEELTPNGEAPSARAASYLRLWFLTVRHGFSLADELFPREIEKSLVMFLLSTIFTKTGLDVLKGIANEEWNDQRDEEIVSKLGAILRLGIFAI